ncbi:MAG: manganese catalase family protein [Clostridia bacterium]|nr:manganese catalase family protein [Clostridia bacterium]
MPKPLIAEGGYPSLKDLQCDAYSARILSSAYATSAGELNASLQYIYHSINFSGKNDDKRAELLKSIAIAEMIHINLLGEALIRLGAPPVYSYCPPAHYNFYSTKFVAYSRTLRNMIEDDIMGEKYAIYNYERMLPRLKNDTLRTLICRILEDENLHVEALKSSLEGLSC